MRSGIVSLLFPPKCVSCGKLLRFEGLGAELPSLCKDCKSRWNSELLDTCGLCGKAISLCDCIPEEIRRVGCVGYRKRVYYLQGKSTAVQNRIIYRIKHRPAARAISFLADELSAPLFEMLSQAGATPEDTVLVYLPRSRRSASAAGTDQAKRLAEALSECTGIPTYPAIRRVANRNQMQRELNTSQRRQNAKQSYVLKDPLDRSRFFGKSVVLIDDIVTTGTTMAAGVRLIRKVGVKQVLALSVAYDDVNKNAELRQPTFQI